MANYTNEFIGYDTNAYNSLKSSIESNRDDIIKIIASLKPVINSLKEHWKGADADKYTAQLTNVVEEATDKIKTLYNGMSNSFDSTHKEWQNKQSQ